MSQIDDLIEKYCPNGVEYKTLGDIGTFERGKGLQKKDFVEDGEVGCIHYGQIYTYYGLFANTTKSRVTKSLAKKCTLAHTGDIVIATTSENLEDVGKAVAWEGSEDIAISGDALVYRHKQNQRYIVYFLRSSLFARQKKTLAFGAKVIRLKPDNFEKVVIPLPPLPVQQKIVEILDKFTALEAELEADLEAELEARRKQYEHYRDKLLTFKPLEQN
jgi:type I restriction enzyme S subunit